MTPYEYYSNLIKYKKKDVSSKLYDGRSLSHAGTYKPAGTHEYVAKIDNAFGPGKHRYFYTKEEWDNYNKNKQGSGQGDRSRYQSNWEKGNYKGVFDTEKHSSNHEMTDNINYKADIKIKDRELNKQLNEFYNEIKAGSVLQAFDTAGDKALRGALYNGKDSEAYKNLVARMKRSMGVYERDRDKFEKKLRDTLKEQYKDTAWYNDYHLENDVKSVMDKIDELYKETKKAYKDVTEDYNGWRENKIRDAYSNYYKNGFTDARDINYLKINGIDKTVDKIFEVKGFNEANGYDKESLKLLRELWTEICKNTKY